MTIHAHYYLELSIRPRLFKRALAIMEGIHERNFNSLEEAFYQSKLVQENREIYISPVTKYLTVTGYYDDILEDQEKLIKTLAPVLNDTWIDCLSRSGQRWTWKIWDHQFTREQGEDY